MLIQKRKNIKTPGMRHSRNYAIYDYAYTKKKRMSVNKNKCLKLKKTKFFYTNFNFKINTKIFKYINMIVKEFVYNTKPYKKFLQCISPTSNNSIFYLPMTESTNIGCIFYGCNFWEKKNFIFKNIIFFIKNIPLNWKFCYLSNSTGNKLTYAKSSGTFCKFLKIINKKKKLLLVELPSKTKLLVSQNYKAYTGKNYNFFSYRLVEGKFGFSLKGHKTLNVRGVAKNPVDHPNGGRTKSVQPERSPWNWIAKHRK